MKNCVRIFLIAGKIARPLKGRLLFEEQKVCKTGILLMLIFHFLATKAHMIVKNLDFCFGTRQKYSSGAFYVFGGFAKNMAVRDSAEDLIGGRLR